MTIVCLHVSMGVTRGVNEKENENEDGSCECGRWKPSPGPRTEQIRIGMMPRRRGVWRNKQIKIKKMKIEE